MNTLLPFPSTIRVVLSTLLFTSLLFSTAWAANPTAPSSPPKRTMKDSATSATTQQQHSGITQQSIKGTITAATSNSITISSKKTHTSHTFKIEPDTAIFKGCKCPGKHTDLAVGQRVKIKFVPHHEETTKALSIHLKRPRTTAKNDSPCNCSSGEHKQPMKGEEKSKEEHALLKLKAGKE